MSSPVRARKHSEPHAAIIGWLFTDWQVTPGIELMDNPTVRLDDDVDLTDYAVTPIAQLLSFLVWMIQSG